MKIEKFSVKTCCGYPSILFKLNGTISKSLMENFKNSGYSESPMLTKSGIMYVDNADLICSGPF